jgi:hypothetical protein
MSLGQEKNSNYNLEKELEFGDKTKNEKIFFTIGYPLYL